MTADYPDYLIQIGARALAAADNNPVFPPSAYADSETEHEYARKVYLDTARTYRAHLTGIIGARLSRVLGELMAAGELEGHHHVVIQDELGYVLNKPYGTKRPHLGRTREEITEGRG